MSNQNTLAEQEQAKMDEFFNPTTEQRQAKMRLMMARMKEPEYQADVAEADAVVERVAEADADVSECLNLDDRNIPSERMLRKSQLAQAKQAQADAVIALEELRGDNLATQAPTTTPVVTAPVVTAAVERDAGAPVPMADAPAQTPAPLPAWQLIPPPSRLPGYRWPLYRHLEFARKANNPRPTAHDVLSAWQTNPPDGMTVSGSRALTLNFTIQTGASKTADAKAVQAAIDKLILSV